MGGGSVLRGIVPPQIVVWRCHCKQLHVPGTSGVPSREGTTRRRLARSTPRGGGGEGRYRACSGMSLAVLGKRVTWRFSKSGRLCFVLPVLRENQPTNQPGSQRSRLRVHCVCGRIGRRKREGKEASVFFSRFTLGRRSVPGRGRVWGFGFQGLRREGGKEEGLVGLWTEGRAAPAARLPPPTMTTTSFASSLFAPPLCVSISSATGLAFGAFCFLVFLGFLFFFRGVRVLDVRFPPGRPDATSSAPSYISGFSFY